FRSNFKSFVISGDAGEILERSFTKITSLNFGPSDYLSKVPYSVRIDCYPEEFFEYSGILNPVDEWRFEEREDGVTTITHNVSANGLNNDELALTNAINFVS